MATYIRFSSLASASLSLLSEWYTLLPSWRSASKSQSSGMLGLEKLKAIQLQVCTQADLNPSRVQILVDASEPLIRLDGGPRNATIHLNPKLVRFALPRHQLSDEDCGEIDWIEQFLNSSAQNWSDQIDSIQQLSDTELRVLHNRFDQWGWSLDESEWSFLLLSELERWNQTTPLRDVAISTLLKVGSVIAIQAVAYHYLNPLALAISEAGLLLGIQCARWRNRDSRDSSSKLSSQKTEQVGLKFYRRIYTQSLLEREMIERGWLESTLSRFQRVKSWFKRGDPFSTTRSGVLLNRFFPLGPPSCAIAASPDLSFDFSAEASSAWIQAEAAVKEIAVGEARVLKPLELKSVELESLELEFATELPATELPATELPATELPAAGLPAVAIGEKRVAGAHSLIPTGSSSTLKICLPTLLSESRAR